MTINDHILVAAWIAAWARSRVRDCYKALDVGCTKASAQFKKHGHGRHLTWKRQTQAQRQDVSVEQLKAYELVEFGSSKQDDVGNRVAEQCRNDVLELSASHDEREAEDEWYDALEVDPTSRTTTVQGGHDDLACNLVPVSEPRYAQDNGRKCQDELPQEPGPVLAMRNRPLDKKLLPGCSQLHSKTDEAQTAEEEGVVGAVGTAHGSKVDSLLTNILSATDFTESLSVSAWVPCEIPGAGGTQFSNVTFRGCEGSGITLMQECELVNVNFINCKFGRATFLDVTLSNVTFSHVDFTDATLYCLVLRNVTLTKVHFKNDIWRATYLENALIGEDSLVLRRGTPSDYGLKALAASSKTIQTPIDDSKTPSDIRQAVGHVGSWDRAILPHFLAANGSVLARLVNHKVILDRIMQYCFPGPSVHIYEYPSRSKIPEERARYMKLHYRRDRTRTACFGSLQDGLPISDKPSGNMPHRGVGDCTGLILVNKMFSKLALTRLYSRELHLQCSAEGAREFILAHAQKMKLVRQLVLYYHWADDQLGLATDINAWKFLLGTVRHQFSFIPNVRLHIGQSFWKRNNIAKGASHVLGYQSSVDCPITDAYKFAAPADRWEVEGKKSTHRTDGITLQIHIEGASTPEEVEFVGELLVLIEKRRVGRPLFVRSCKGEETVYRCAGQFWENR